MLLALLEAHRAGILTQALQQPLCLGSLSTLAVDTLRGQACGGAGLSWGRGETEGPGALVMGRGLAATFTGILGGEAWPLGEEVNVTLGAPEPVSRGLTALCDVVHTAVHNHWDVRVPQLLLRQCIPGAGRCFLDGSQPAREVQPPLSLDIQCPGPRIVRHSRVYPRPTHPRPVRQPQASQGPSGRPGLTSCAPPAPAPGSHCPLGWLWRSR